ncbi:MAG TPA: ribulose-bisphosphate carboxylase large subunit, partial [Actinomycetes bacterium]
ALEACVRARNEGRAVEKEARAVLAEAARHSPALAIAMETWKEVTFDFDVVDKLATK